MHDVSFSYAPEPVLSRVYFKILPLDLVSLTGPNGGGKTTLFRLLLGLVRPNQGTIRIFGQPPERARTRMGYVPQYARFDPRFPISVKDVVAMGRLGNLSTGPYRAADRRAALDALEEVGLAGLRNRPFADLSGGQRQRVLIARALACAPELLGKLNQRLTILMASHDVGFVTRLVKQCLCVNRSVVRHPTAKLNGGIIAELYGSEMAMVRHDHALSGPGNEPERNGPALSPPGGGPAAGRGRRGGHGRQ